MDDNKPVAVPNTISASRIPAMLGMDSRCSPLSLFLRMTGAIKEQSLDEDVAIQQGRFYEKATAEWACAVYGMKLVDGFEQRTLRNGVLSGHPDFLAVDEHGKLVILEVKNPFWSYSGNDWGESGTDQVPKPYFIQASVYGDLFREWCLNHDNAMMISDTLVKLGCLSADDVAERIADYTYVVAKLSGGIQRFKVPIDQEIIAMVTKEADAFLVRVATGDMPSPQDETDMRNRWPVTEDKAVECDIAFLETLRALSSVRAQAKALSEQESTLKALILGFAQDAAKIQHRGIVVATLDAQRAFDAEACLAAHPDLLTKGYAKLDTTKLAKEQKALHEMYMRKPENAVDQTRVIRLKLPKEVTK